MPYETLKINLNEIRLVTLLPDKSGNAASSPIRCRLDVVSLNDRSYSHTYRQHLRQSNDSEDRAIRNGWIQLSEANQQRDFPEWIFVPSRGDDATTHLPDFRYSWGDFMALSYTWGDPTDVREIWVNNMPMQVTANIEACLRVLREKHYIQHGWKVWIDALCINQQDIIERAGEVKRMREIYSKAWTPLVWTGKAADDSDGALELMLSLANDYASLEDSMAVLTRDLHRDPELFGVGRWRALYHFATRQYWRRTWILQEAGLGRSTMPVLCGQQTISWIHISKAMGLVFRSDELVNVYITNELKDAGSSFDRILWITMLVIRELQRLQDDNLSSHSTNLLRLLHLCRHALSTDLRDKIYGLLGLMSQSLVRLISPDYAAPVIEVYTDFVKCAVQAEDSLDVLRFRSPSENLELPTWVPDWTIEPWTPPLTLGDTPFTTTGTSSPSVSYINDGRLLVCQAFQLDAIDGLGTLWAHNSWPPDTILPPTGSANAYGSFQAARTAIWSSMLTSRTVDFDVVRGDASAALLATPALAAAHFLPGDDSPLRALTKTHIFACCVRYLKNNAALRIAGHALREYLITDMRPADVDARVLREALMQSDRVNIQRRMVVTRKGYVGMVPEATRESDVIVALLGCSMPMVLRPVRSPDDDDGRGREQFQVVGECYVHGLMDGQAMAWLEEGEVKLEDITLC